MMYSLGKLLLSHFTMLFLQTELRRTKLTNNLARNYEMEYHFNLSITINDLSENLVEVKLHEDRLFPIKLLSVLHVF